MEILAISGSIRSKSYNTALLYAASDLSPAHVNVTLLESVEAIPIFDPQIDDNDLPQSVNTLIDKIKNADGVMISSPEYAHGPSGVIKNLLDWLVATDALVLKPVVVATVSTSGLGGIRAFSAIVQILSAMNANVLVDGSLCVPYASMRFDDALKLTDEVTKQALDVSLMALEKVIVQHE